MTEYEMQSVLFLGLLLNITVYSTSFSFCSQNLQTFTAINHLVSEALLLSSHHLSLYKRVSGFS